MITSHNKKNTENKMRKGYRYRIATLAVACARGSRADTFVGPGLLECQAGSCTFDVEPGLGCNGKIWKDDTPV